MKLTLALVMCFGLMFGVFGVPAKGVSLQVTGKQEQKNEAESLYFAMEKKILEAKSIKVVWDAKMDAGPGERGNTKERSIFTRRKSGAVASRGGYWWRQGE